MAQLKLRFQGEFWAISSEIMFLNENKRIRKYCIFSEESRNKKIWKLSKVNM